VPKAVHKAGFHPTAVVGAMGAAAGVGAALGLEQRQMVDALGIAGSMAGGIIEYLAEAPGPSGYIRAGRRNPGCARRCWDATVFSARAPYSKACTGCFTASPIPRRAITMR